MARRKAVVVAARAERSGEEFSGEETEAEVLERVEELDEEESVGIGFAP